MSIDLTKLTDVEKKELFGTLEKELNPDKKPPLIAEKNKPGNHKLFQEQMDDVIVSLKGLEGKISKLESSSKEDDDEGKKTISNKEEISKVTESLASIEKKLGNINPSDGTEMKNSEEDTDDQALISKRQNAIT